jgi:hypothetical protein
VRIVGFGHRSEHGKDTCSNFLSTALRVRKPGLRIKQLNFADKLKDITFQLYGWAGVKRGVHYNNCRADRKIILPALGCTVVTLWVRVGEKLREVFPDTWLNFVCNTDHQADVVLVADVRHPNEADTIVDRQDGSKLYKVYNHRIPNRETIPGEESIDDKLDGYSRWHGQIDNAEGLSELNGQMESLADSLLGEWGLK